MSFETVLNTLEGTVLEITFKGNAAEAWLLDEASYCNFRSGIEYKGWKCIPGNNSKGILNVPYSADWYVVILSGGRGYFDVSVGVEKAAPSLTSLVNPTPQSQDGAEAFDVFISHASEDKQAIAEPLAKLLRDNHGLRVWYDDFEFKIGSSSSRGIAQGIATSRFSVVVLSREFLTKKWTNHELKGVLQRSIDGQQRLLPIWHNITYAEVLRFDPSLADYIARDTTKHSVDTIAAEIADVIGRISP